VCGECLVFIESYLGLKFGEGWKSKSGKEIERELKFFLGNDLCGGKQTDIDCFALTPKFL
jgi:hypothetical protein